MEPGEPFLSRRDLILDVIPKMTAAAALALMSSSCSEGEEELAAPTETTIPTVQPKPELGATPSPEYQGPILIEPGTIKPLKYFAFSNATDEFSVMINEGIFHEQAESLGVPLLTSNDLLFSILPVNKLANPDPPHQPYIKLTQATSRLSEVQIAFGLLIDEYDHNPESVPSPRQRATYLSIVLSSYMFFGQCYIDLNKYLLNEIQASRKSSAYNDLIRNSFESLEEVLFAHVFDGIPQPFQRENA